ncbi:MAG TPA: hypothetical protein VFJ19_17135 [Nocardioidaceae bacterium]|nr:hypothetical protein [Nocardioidaceae bacterium]
MTWTTGRVVALLYVAVVAALAAAAFSGRDAGFSWGTEGVAMLLTLPVLIPALPVIYLLGAGIWSLTDAGDGGPMWPVTLVYAAMFGAVAVANLWVLRLAMRTLRRRRSAHSG